MGAITPPVGLASFAAAGIAGEDAIKTGIQGSLYALRTVVLPFVFVFNPTLLLIDVRGWWELAVVAFAAIAASLVFAAAPLGGFGGRGDRRYERRRRGYSQDRRGEARRAGGGAQTPRGGGPERRRARRRGSDSQ